MSHTPTKQKSSSSQQFKLSGKKIPPNEVVESSSVQDKNASRCQFACIIDKLKEHYLITTIVFGVIVLACLLTPFIIMFFQTENEHHIMQGPKVAVPLTSGNTFTSQVYQFKKGDKSFNATINAITFGGTRLLQESQFASPKQMSYYHKTTQISASIDTNMNVHIRIPGDTGMDYVISDAPPQSESALERMPQFLPKALQTSLQEVTGKPVTITTSVSYDGVYNNQTKEYRLLTVENSYHPDEFARIAPNEANLCDANPAVSNFSDIEEVTSKIAETVSSIVSNLKNAIINNQEKLQKVVGNINTHKVASSEENSYYNPQEEAITKCIRLGSQVIRCTEDVWKSGLLKVSNIDANNFVEVWEIVVETTQ